MCWCFIVKWDDGSFTVKRGLLKEGGDASMVTWHGGEECYVSEPIKNCYEVRTHNRIALLTEEATYVHACGQAFVRKLSISDDRPIPGTSKLVQANAIDMATKASVQLRHSERIAKIEP